MYIYTLYFFNWYFIFSLIINSNFDGYTNSIYTISIGAITHDDKKSSYSEECSAQLAVTYSSGSGKYIVIII